MHLLWRKTAEELICVLYKYLGMKVEFEYFYETYEDEWWII